MNFAERARELNDDIVAARRYLHRHAELSLQEKNTTDFLIVELEKLGIPVTSFPDYTGCIATIQGKVPGRTVLLRADIDALPIKEESGVPFASENEGVMHACGHDCHTAMLLGAARLLQERRGELKGTVKLLFQAGEEAFTGSHYYWDRGYLDGVDAAMGMHVWPTLESGKLCVQDGPLMASCDNFTLTVHGVSAHGSTPNRGKDAIVAASAIVMDIQSIVSRFNDPLDPLVVTVGTIRAGTQFNIIADTAVMEGTVRSHSRDARTLVEGNLRRIAASTAESYGCTAELDYRYIESQIVNADKDLNAIARGAAVNLYGEDVLASTALASGSEDFSYIMEHIPSSLFVFLGCHDKETGAVHPLHSGKFRVNEDILHVGAAQYAQFAADYLAGVQEGRR